MYSLLTNGFHEHSKNELVYYWLMHSPLLKEFVRSTCNPLFYCSCFTTIVCVVSHCLRATERERLKRREREGALNEQAQLEKEVVSDVLYV